MIPLSVLDFTSIKQGGSAAATLRETVALAQHAEGLGYRRHWIVEHHNAGNVAGAAVPVVLAHIASHTKTIRVGAGGVILPNHAPLIVAEQFGTLAALHPGRIDLGLGRGVAIDAATAAALRRGPGDMDAFPSDVQELLAYFRGDMPDGVRAIPGEGADVMPWILSASMGGAQLAAALGLPYAYASHFAPDALDAALAAYRGNFKASVWCDKPHVMLAINGVAADSDAQARYLFSTTQQASAGPLPPPLPDFEQRIDPAHIALVMKYYRHSVVGGPETVAQGVRAFVEHYRPDELTIMSQIFDPAARLKSYEIFARLMG
jgi:luciferase family oxidoreductase group 1